MIGGGLYNTGTVYICCGSKIHHNSAASGAGIYNLVVVDEGTATITITDDSEITFNAALESGGGIYNQFGSRLYAF
jgi:hypothetical protein